MPSKVLPCKCKHPFQDKEYGQGMRLHNFARKASAQGGLRCTVCLEVKQATGAVNEATEAVVSKGKK